MSLHLAAVLIIQPSLFFSFFFFRNTPMRFTSHATLLQTSGRRRQNATRCRGVRFGTFFCVFVSCCCQAAAALDFLFFFPPNPRFFLCPSVLTSRRCDIPVRIHGFFVCPLCSHPRVFLYVCVCVCLVRIIQMSLCQKLL